MRTILAVIALLFAISVSEPAFANVAPGSGNWGGGPGNSGPGDKNGQNNQGSGGQTPPGQDDK
jgi:hypothetical protein